MIYQPVNSLAIDKNNNIWIGTTYGASEYNGKAFSNFTANNGLASDWVTCILQTKDGNIWFGSKNKGIAVFTPKNH